jgi:hypothetical protein
MSSGGSKVKAPTIATPQIDISSAVNSILQSAATLVPALQSAGVNLDQSSLQSNALLAGYGQASNQSIEMEQALLGQKPTDLNGQAMIQQVQAYQSDVLGQLGGDARTAPVQDALSQLNAQVSASYNPNLSQAQQQAAYQQAMSTFGTLNTALGGIPPSAGTPAPANKYPGLQNGNRLNVDTATQYLTGAGLMQDIPAFKNASPGGENGGDVVAGFVKNTDTIPNQASSVLSGIPAGAAQGFMTNQQFADWLQTQGPNGAAPGGTSGSPGSPQTPNMAQYQSQLQDLQLQMQSTYGQQQQPLSGQSLQNMIQSNPIYQSEYGVGLQTLQRQAAASGMEDSGNTLAAAETFGQTLSGSVYNTLFQNTAALANQTLPVAQNAATNLNATGQTSYNAATAPAQATAGAQNQVGVLQGQTAIAQGQIGAQVGIANAQNQLQASMANAQTAASNASGIGSIAGTLLGRFI